MGQKLEENESHARHREDGEDLNSVCRMSLRLPSQASHQQANHGDLDERFAGLHFALIVRDQPPVTKQPSECPFNNPALWWLAPATRTRRLAVLFGLAGVQIGMVDTSQGAYAAELLPATVRGTGFGTLTAVNGLGDTISSIVVGLLWTAFAPAATFGFGVLFAVAGVLLLPRVVRAPELEGR